MTQGEPPARVEDRERADIVETLHAHRHFLRYTLRDLSDEQAAQRTTVSQLCLGGLVKHLTRVERGWMDFVMDRQAGLGAESAEDHGLSFQMSAGETVSDLLAEYGRAAQETDEILASVTDPDASHPLPTAPWFPPGARRSNRRVFLHLIAETAQHAGHADIIREAIDGAKTMG